VILLDTNAVLWIDRGHPRANVLRRSSALYVSPATILELQFLIEAGKIQLRSGSVESFVDDDRWIVDDPPAIDWFQRSCDLSWARDPFDRLIVAHALLRRWRIATADGSILECLGPSGCVEI
jgi:PIN domain nuclease of toxin-antitoxin system